MTTTSYFPTVEKIKFEGKDSKNPTAFRYYDPEKVVKGKKMKDWFKFSMAWWHTLCAEGGDQFGGGTKTFPWNARHAPSSAPRPRWTPDSSSCRRWASSTTASTTWTS